MGAEMFVELLKPSSSFLLFIHLPIHSLNKYLLSVMRQIQCDADKEIKRGLSIETSHCNWEDQHTHKYLIGTCYVKC